jgi:tetratricopeptide (TPR) repeat protein
MGDFRRAFELTAGTEPPAKSGAAPLLHYYAAYFAAALGRAEEARRHRLAARAADSDYCFPSRVEEIPILRAAIDADPSDPKAPYYLGNLLYDKRRHTEAIALWERSSELDPGFSVVWRNLGVGHYNISGRPEDALAAYDNAHRCAPDDARVFYERDQLWKRVGFAPNRRLEALNARADLVALRDDLCIEFTGLLNQTGQPDKALAILLGRSFQPFEGGEGAVLEEYARCRLKLGHAALTRSDPVEAQRQFEAALTPPTNLGEARHLLANQSDVRYWAGVACAAIGERERAADHWRAAAEFRGDFLGMEVHPFSEKTFYSLLAMKEIGLASEFSAAVDGLEAYARDLMKKPAAIDYFATSLPTMLIFDEDIQRRQNNTACVMLAQACMARGERESAEQWLRKVLRQDPSHAHAADLLAELSSSL